MKNFLMGIFIVIMFPILLPFIVLKWILQAISEIGEDFLISLKRNLK